MRSSSRLIATLAVEAMPALLLPRKGQHGLIDYEKMFCPDLKSGQDVFTMRGIDRRAGCIVVVRPDQYVAQVLPIDAFLRSRRTSTRSCGKRADAQTALALPTKARSSRRAFRWFESGSRLVQFKKVLRGQISSIVICVLKAVSIHSGQRGNGRMTMRQSQAETRRQMSRSGR